MFWPLFLLIACAPCPDGAVVCKGEFHRGEAATIRGLDPLGGWYNPELERCTLVAKPSGDGWRRRSEYDKKGRLVLEEAIQKDRRHLILYRWDGACVDRIDRTEPFRRVLVERDCEQGLATRETRSRVDESGKLTEIWTADIFHTLDDDGRVVQQTTEHAAGWTEQVDYTWNGDRVDLTRTRYETVEHTVQYTWSDDGQLESTRRQAPDGRSTVARYRRDERGRVTRLEVDGKVRSRWQHKLGRKWPSSVDHTDGPRSGTDKLQYKCKL